MMQRKIAYSEIALSKRKKLKRELKEKYGKAYADKFSKNVSKTIAELKRFPEMGVSMREKYDRTAIIICFSLRIITSYTVSWMIWL